MKYDLIFSDAVALFVGLFGLFATVITLEKALLHYVHGDPMVGIYMAVFGLVLFLVSRCFLISRPYEKMLAMTVFTTGPLFSALCLKASTIRMSPFTT